MKFILRVLLISGMLCLFYSGKSQSCGTCSINITSLDSSSYTVNSGETFCVDTTGNFVGTITLNGGTICNRGVFSAKVLTINNGVLSNYSNLSINTNASFGSSCQLNNYGGAILNVNGSLTVSGASIVNDGIINIYQNISNSGSVTNTNIINCYQLTGSGTVNNTGVINQN